jgi:serine/threonine-protein kinase
MPGGTVPLDSPFYVERPPAEKTCYDLIVTDKAVNALIRIKAPRQMGKSSLMVQIFHCDLQ